jgi:uncharacterized protein (DUF305 family)
MRNSQVLSAGLAVLAAGLLVTPVLANQPAPDPGAARIETDFLMGMVPHHRSAVAMAEMALEKASHQELKDKARVIIDDQNREIEQMSHMGAGMQDLESRSGAEFEQAFLSEMSHHHAMAIMMAAPVLVGGHHGELFTLAENVVVSQGQEIRQMDQWLQAWYGIERPIDRPMMNTGMPDMPMSPGTPTPMDGDMGH